MLKVSTHTWSTKTKRTWWLSNNYFTVRLFQVVIKADITDGKCSREKIPSHRQRVVWVYHFVLNFTFTRNIWQFTNSKQNPLVLCTFVVHMFASVTWFEFLFHLIFVDSQCDTFRKWLSDFFPEFNMFHFTDCMCSLTICHFVSANRFFTNQPICWHQTVAIKIKK